MIQPGFEGSKYMFSQSYSALENQPIAMPLEVIQHRLITGQDAVGESSSNIASEQSPEIRSSKIDYLMSSIMIINHNFETKIRTRGESADNSCTLLVPKIIVFRLIIYFLSR